jgi:hypothetical protein
MHIKKKPKEKAILPLCNIICQFIFMLLRKVIAVSMIYLYLHWMGMEIS